MILVELQGIEPGSWQFIADCHATALAKLSVHDVKARPVLDWAIVLRHMTFY